MSLCGHASLGHSKYFPFVGTYILQQELQEEEAVLDSEGASGRDGSTRMLKDEVTPDDIASVVAAWTGEVLEMHS